jgi:hypothetical protein
MRLMISPLHAHMMMQRHGKSQLEENTGAPILERFEGLV